MIRIDLTGFDRFQAGAGQAIIRALNRAGDAARTVLVRETSAAMKIKQAYVRPAIVTSPATASRPSVTIRATAKRLSLMAFGAKRGARGARARGKVYQGAFLARLKNGHEGVFSRRGKSRLPIYELYGPSVWAVAESHAETAALRGREVLDQRLEHEMRRELERAAVR